MKVKLFSHNSRKGTNLCPSTKSSIIDGPPSAVQTSPFFISPLVDEKPSRVFIVGGGPSLKDFNFSRLSNEDTITVNSSVFDVPNPNYFITMDYTWLTKNEIQYNTYNTLKQKKFSSKHIHKIFVVAFSGERCIKTNNGVIDRKFDLEYDLRIFDRTIFVSGYGGIGLTFSDFRAGSDSGYSALQLAVILGYKQIYLLGMDFTVEKGGSTISSGRVSLRRRIHYYQIAPRSVAKEFEKKLEEFLIPYPRAFEEIKEKTTVKVFSCSSISRLNQYIPYISVDRVLS